MSIYLSKLLIYIKKIIFFNEVYLYIYGLFLLKVQANFKHTFQETWSSCKGASGLSPDHGMPTLDYKWQRHHSHSRSFSSSHFDEVQRAFRYISLLHFPVGIEYTPSRM